MKRFAKKLILLLSILGSIATIVIFTYLFVFSLKYWKNNFPIGYPTEIIAFYTAVFVTITTVIWQWIDGRITSIKRDVISFKKLKGGIPNGRERNKIRKARS